MLTALLPVFLCRRYKKFSNAVLKVLEEEKNEFTRSILKSSIIDGNSDIYVFSHFSITRGSSVITT